nr:MAG TPA: protein of unknown function (DUF4224) [Caudoviricetes sp.]
MTNYEHYKEQIEKIARLGWRVAVDKDNNPHACNEIKCDDCIAGGYNCYQILSKWADAEYIEQEVDWSKVAVDTPILVSIDNVQWYCRHFAKYENGLFYVWDDGRTSYTTDAKSRWEYAKLAEVE